MPIGIARSAIDAVVALATYKTPHGSRVLLRDRENVQADVARAETALASARAFLCATFDELWEEVASASGTPASVRRRTMARLACVHAARAAAEAVDLLCHAAGGADLFETGRLERCFRDVHACTQHIATSSSDCEMAGRVLLGIDLIAARP